MYIEGISISHRIQSVRLRERETERQRREYVVTIYVIDSQSVYRREIFESILIFFIYIHSKLYFRFVIIFSQSIEREREREREREIESKITELQFTLHYQSV